MSIYILDENNISKQIGEEYEYIIMTKSEMEKYEKYKKEEIDERTVEVRAKDGSYQSIIKE